MKARTNLKKIYILVCTNPECPNYGLLQVSEEEMLKYYKDEEKKEN